MPFPLKPAAAKPPPVANPKANLERQKAQAKALKQRPPKRTASDPEMPAVQVPEK